ncbi:late embryogenesis abundant protein At1g64065-like [Humulus lupulus]|uniref:late embryogenesis abundant protein At1g64065-like n=1 Tax=Humulus lupulus TaxID=3486 RepID=UPI002B406225|nr:late embryogenesis abundant protein At1g64065-like [Humulus lupulus]
MAGNTQQVHPHDEFDFEETGSMESDDSTNKELHHRRKMRRLYLVAVVVLILTVGILVFSITIFHINAPSFRIRSFTIDELTISSANTVDMKFEAEMGIKNTDFGHFDFEQTSLSFFYRGARLALGHDDDDHDDSLIDQGIVKARSTKKIKFSAEMGTTSSMSAEDIESRYFTLNCKATMNGTIHLMKLIKRKRSSEMNCNVNINLYTKVVLDIKCK